MKLLLRFLALAIVVATAQKAPGQTAGFTASTTSGCAPQVVTFTNTSTGTITANNWNFGNGATSVLQNPSTTYTSPGTYTITLTVTFSGGATATATSTIIVYGKPTVTFSAGNTTGCRPHTTAFTAAVTPNSPGPVSYSWAFGDGSMDTAANPTHTYFTPGSYGVSLTVTNGAGCQTIITQPALIQVLGNNPFAASPLNNCRAPANVTLSTPAHTGVSTTWDFGDGSTGSGNTITHTYAASGSYTVMMIQTFTAAGCNDTIIRPAYVQVRGRTATFSGPFSLCDNATATFLNTTSATPAHWTFGDGKTSYGISAQHAYSSGGIFNVRMATTVGGCPDTAFRTITVHATPNPLIAMAPSIPCPPPVPITFSVPGLPSGCTYSWAWASGGTATTAAATKVYNTPYQRDSVMVTVTTPAGCTGTGRLDSIEIHDIALFKKISPLPTEGCIPLRIDFDSVRLETTFPDSAAYPSPIISYSWNFGDGSALSSAPGVGHAYNTFGTYVASITVTTGNGCSVTDTAHIHAGTKIPPSYVVLRDSNCIGAGMLLQNTTAPPAPLYSWSVSPEGGPTWMTHSSTVIAKVLAQGTTRFYLVSYNNGCKDTFSRLVRTYGSGAFYTYAIHCPPSLDVTFTNRQVGSTSMLWNFGDGTTSTSMAPAITHTYPSTGTYICRQSTYDSNTGCTDTFSQVFTLSRPQSSLYVSDTTLCAGQRVLLIGSFTGRAIGYSWAIDNLPVRRRDTVRHLLLSKLAPGYHTITFRDTFQTLGSDTLTCVDSIRRVNHIFLSNPIASFTATPKTGCAPLQVSFNSNSMFTPGAGFTKLNWDYGDGGKDSGLLTPVSHTYAPGIYNVSLTVSDSNGCSSSRMEPKLIDSRKIVAAFAVNKTAACAGEALQFAGYLSGGASPLSYRWYFGDGDSSWLDNPTHAYSDTGTYTVKLIVTDDATGCADSLTRTAFISVARPRASFTLSDTFGICAPLVVRFTSTSTGAATYAWSFGDGNSSTLAGPTNTYGTPGVYNVRLIARNAAGCADTSAFTTVRVLGYAGALTYKPLTGCAPMSVNFRALVTNAPSLVWDFSDGVTMPAHGDTISHLYLTPGKYIPKLIFSNGAGCTSSSVGLDTIKVDAVTAGFTMSPPCERTYITFTDTSRGVLVNPILSLWTIDSGQVKSGNPISWRFPAAGEYDVTLVTSNWSNCRDTLTKRITVHPLPVVKATGDTAVCVPDAAQLHAYGAQSYAWSPAASLSCSNCRNPLASPTAPTAYIVSGADSNGCVNADTVVIGIQHSTGFTTLDSGAICAGESFQLQATGATTYLWSPDSTLDHPDIADPIARPTRSTTYVVVAKEGSCKADTQKVRVRVYPVPVIDAGKDERMVAGNSVQLQASGTNIDHLEWSPDSVLSCTTCYGPVASPSMTTTFYLRAYSDKGCEAKDSVTVRVLCDGSQLFLPNTFTPNGDGLNDYFFPRGKGTSGIESFRIFSRWGELLFDRDHISVNDEYAGWNGTVKGRELPPDVYVYLIVAWCGAGERIAVKGDVTLMR